MIYRRKKPSRLFCVWHRTERTGEDHQEDRLLPRLQAQRWRPYVQPTFFIWSHFTFADRFMAHHNWIPATELIFFLKWIQERECLEMTFTISLHNILWCQGKPASQFTIQTTNVRLDRHLYLGTAGKKKIPFLFSLVTRFTKKNISWTKLGLVHLHPDVSLSRRKATEMASNQSNRSLRFPL